MATIANISKVENDVLAVNLAIYGLTAMKIDDGIYEFAEIPLKEGETEKDQRYCLRMVGQENKFYSCTIGQLASLRIWTGASPLKADCFAHEWKSQTGANPFQDVLRANKGKLGDARFKVVSQLHILNRASKTPNAKTYVPSCYSGYNDFLTACDLIPGDAKHADKKIRDNYWKERGKLRNVLHATPLTYELATPENEERIPVFQVSF